MRNFHRELVSAEKFVKLSPKCPDSTCRDLVRLSIKDLDDILTASEDFESEEALLLRCDIASLLEILVRTTVAEKITPIAEDNDEGDKDC